MRAKVARAARQQANVIVNRFVNEGTARDHYRRRHPLACWKYWLVLIACWVVYLGSFGHLKSWRPVKPVLDIRRVERWVKRQYKRRAPDVVKAIRHRVRYAV